VVVSVAETPGQDLGRHASPRAKAPVFHPNAGTALRGVLSVQMLDHASGASIINMAPSLSLVKLPGTAATVVP
jgi:hypothetical protein